MESIDSIGLIVGLGNPGKEYDNTRHNLGFMVVDRILEKLSGEIEEKNHCSSQVYAARFKGRKLLLQKPATFMNLSGLAVKKLMAREGMQPENLLVIHDDMDLELGRLRIRSGGSNGGHNGVGSIIESLGGAKNFSRLRLGIGHGKETVEHVLSPFSDDEKVIVGEVVECAAQAAIEILSGGLTRAMNKYNSFQLKAESEQSGAADKK